MASRSISESQAFRLRKLGWRQYGGPPVGGGSHSLTTPGKAGLFEGKSNINEEVMKQGINKSQFLQEH